MSRQGAYAAARLGVGFSQRGCSGSSACIGPCPNLGLSSGPHLMADWFMSEELICMALQLPVTTAHPAAHASLKLLPLCQQHTVVDLG